MSAIVHAYGQVYACKSNDRFLDKKKIDARIQFAFILVDVSGICSRSVPVNRMEIKPTVFMQQVLELT